MQINNLRCTTYCETCKTYNIPLQIIPQSFTTCFTTKIIYFTSFTTCCIGNIICCKTLKTCFIGIKINNKRNINHFQPILRIYIQFELRLLKTHEAANFRGL